MKIEIECQDNGRLPIYIYVNGEKQEKVKSFNIHADLEGITAEITKYVFPYVANDEKSLETEKITVV